MAGKVIGVEHIGVAVRDPRARLSLWADALGLSLDGAEAVASEGVRTWFLEAGETDIELLEALSADTTVGRFLERNGEGIHHLCLRVDDLGAVLARLARAGIEPVGGQRGGARGARVAFLHPRDTGGVLIELSQPAIEQSAGASRAVFGEGSLVILYLREPREQCAGVIRRLDSMGVALDGMDLDAWDDWVAQWARSEEGPLAPSLQFYPSSRIEKILLDRDSDDLPSLARKFEERTGRSLLDALDAVRGLSGDLPGAS
jgi:methylmalonyl-CoA epimerase